MKKLLLGLVVAGVLTSCNTVTNVPQENSQPTVSVNADKPLATQFEGKPLTDAEVKMAIERPNEYGPAIILTDDGIIKNDSYKKLETQMLNDFNSSKDDSNLSAQVLECDLLWGNDCKISAVWTYKGASNVNRHYLTALLNRTTQMQVMTASASEQSQSNISGGIDAKGIKAELAYFRTDTLSTSVTANVPANSRVSVYTFQAGEGGYGTQYQYPNRFVSCYAAGVQCKKSNFSAFGARALSYELVK